MSHGPLLTEWARLLVGSLARAGVRRAVISPGSRSTPFAVAALREPELECTSAFDERSAAFFALGQSKLSGDPTLLISTSGSAGAHYYPAVVEASLAHAPLLVLTADRPPELHDCGAPQTVDQARLFGSHARAYADLGLPDAHPDALRALVRRAAQAVHSSLWPLPGPVQLNAAARKPLEPAPRSAPLSLEIDALLERGPPLVARPEAVPEAAGIRAIANACARARRGLIRCGVELPWRAASSRVLARLAELTGFPVVAEWPSQLRLASTPGAGPLGCDAAALLLSSERFAESVRPDLVLHVGGPLLAPGSDRLIGDDTELHVVARHGWPDPSQRARSLLFGDLDPTLTALTDELSSPAIPAVLERHRRAYRDLWAAGNAAAWRAVSRELEDAGDALDEGAVTRMSVAALPPGGVLSLGNSLPIRHVELYCPAPPHELSVLSQRGANGIDGLVSSALGAASLGRPTLLIVGDVSVLHDAGGFALAPAARAPIAVVVIHNGGGRIFEQLPVAAAVRPEELRYFTTPGRPELAHLAALHGIRHRLVRTRGELGAALQQAVRTVGCTLIEARVPEHAAAAQRDRLFLGLERELAELREAP